MNVTAEIVANKVDVVHVCYGGEGGQLSAVRTLVKQFNDRNISSGIVALGAPAKLISSPEEWNNPSELRLVPLNRRADVSSMIGVAQTIQDLRPRIIICHSLRHAASAFLGSCLSLRKPRLVVVEHQSTKLRSPRDNILSSIAVACSSGIVFLTPQYMQGYPLRLLCELMGKPQFVIPNGVSWADKPLGRSHSQKSYGTRVQSVGVASRLVKSKQHEVLIESVASLITRKIGGVHWRLLIAGVGPAEGYLREVTMKLGMEQHVHFLGHVPNHQLGSFYASLDVYAHTSLGEGNSIALLEAANAGVPIVASDVTGINNVFVNEETALLVPSSSSDAMAAAIQRASSRPFGLKMGIKAQTMVRQKYSAESVATKYLNAFQKVDPEGAWMSKG